MLWRKLQIPVFYHSPRRLDAGITPNHKLRDDVLLSKILHRLKAIALLLTIHCAGLAYPRLLENVFKGEFSD